MSHPDLPLGPRFFKLAHQWGLIYQPRRYYAFLRRRYGEVVTLRTPNYVLVMALTSEGARQILAAAPDGYSAFQKAEFTSLAGPGSLWVLEGERHRRERHLLAPAFHGQRIHNYGRMIQEVALQYVTSWKPRQLLCAYEHMLDISRDLIIRSTFGIEGGAAFDEGRRTLKGLLHAAQPLTVFVEAFQTRWFPPWRRFRRAMNDFSEFVSRRLAERRADGKVSHDVMGLLLAARDEEGKPVPDDKIRDELFTILISGHETTAVALAWAMYELARHPAVLSRLRDELGSDPSRDLGAVVKNRYLGAVCDETLRRHTILAEVARVTRTPRELLGYTIPSGTAVGISISAIHQDPAIYPEPDRFLPERFLDRTFSPFEFLPFGGGHRRCLGAAFSDYEMRIVLATIVSRWDLESVDQEREIRHNIATGPKYGVQIQVRAR